jgi:DNA-binding transcriptional LysR family regulator
MPPLNSPADIAAHSVIVGPQGVTDWSFRKGGTATSVRIDGRLKIPALEGALTAAAAGMGIVMVTAAAIRRELANGSLVPVLPDWDLGSVDLQAVFTQGRAAKPSARALVAYLIEALSDA